MCKKLQQHHLSFLWKSCILYFTEFMLTQVQSWHIWLKIQIPGLISCQFTINCKIWANYQLWPFESMTGDDARPFTGNIPWIPWSLHKWPLNLDSAFIQTHLPIRWIGMNESSTLVLMKALFLWCPQGSTLTVLCIYTVYMPRWHFKNKYPAYLP